MCELCIPFWVTLILTLTSDLISRFFVSGAYTTFITNTFPHMCLMPDQFLWGHSLYCSDISCSNSEYSDDMAHNAAFYQRLH